MYKIYVNDTPLLLTSVQAVPIFPVGNDTHLTLRYPGKKKFIHHVLQQSETSYRFESITVFTEDLDKLWADFREVFKYIEAAGGVVQNEKGETLLIFRRAHWDLPKGKIDKGETPTQAAIREVKEETGLRNLELGDALPDTWHTYVQNGKRILKRTYWFKMTTSDQVLHPQQDEDIELAVWRPLDGFLREKPANLFGSIRDVLEAVNQTP